MSFKFWKPEAFSQSAVQFGKSFVESAKSFYQGDGSSFMKRHGGKVLMGAALASTVLGVINASTSTNKPSKLDSADIIEKDRKYVVN